jgi:UDP-N-acetylglucosamine 2-epimerase
MEEVEIVKMVPHVIISMQRTIGIDYDKDADLSSGSVAGCEVCLREGDRMPESARLIEPVGYLDMLILEKNAKKILTDSGGVQKEAYIFNVPCITLRDNTEWVETVEDGWNVLVGANKEKIAKMANDFEPEGEQRNVFGSGDASARIAGSIKEEREWENLK